MPGWTVHSYWTVPGVLTVVVNVLPLPNSGDLKSAPEFATASWSTVSSFSQQTVSPTPAVVFSGSNLMFAILITTESLGQASEDAEPEPSSPPPQAASRAARSTRRTARITRG